MRVIKKILLYVVAACIGCTLVVLAVLLAMRLALLPEATYDV